MGTKGETTVAADANREFASTTAAADGQEEREWLLRVLAGDHEVFGKLVARYMQRAYYGALGLVGSHADALDLSQEAFVRAFRARDSLDPERPFYTWYYQILRRLCFNQGRDQRNRQRLQNEAESWLVAEAYNRGPLAPEQQSEADELQQRTRRAIESLPDIEREVIVLRELEELSYREIAELLNIPQGTVMSRLYSARKRLANELLELK